MAPLIMNFQEENSKNIYQIINNKFIFSDMSRLPNLALLILALF